MQKYFDIFKSLILQFPRIYIQNLILYIEKILQNIIL